MSELPTVTVNSGTACGHCGVVFNGTTFDKHQTKEACGVYLTRAGVTRKEMRGFNEAVSIIPPTSQQAGARAIAMVVFDGAGHCAIELRRNESVVTYIPYSIAGLTVERLDIKKLDYNAELRRRVDSGFDVTYKPAADYPTGRAATKFVAFALQAGATAEALQELGRLVTISAADQVTAATVLARNKETRDKATAVDAGKHGVIKAKKPRKVRDNAASMFKGLILEGTLTDEQIVAKVRDTFPDSKATTSYVSTYRSQLRKTGQLAPKV